MPRLLALRVYYFAGFAALGVYLPFFPTWLQAHELGGAAIGVVIAALPAMGVVGPPCFGFLADALALRAGLLRLACAGAFSAFGLLAVLSAGGVPLGFLPLTLLVAIFALFRSPMVVLADVVALESAAGAGTTYGRLRLWGSVGFLLAAAAAGKWLVLPDEVRSRGFDVRSAALPAAVSAALLIALAASFFMPGKATLPARAHPRQLRALLGGADFQLFLMAAFFGQAGHAAYDLVFSRHLRDLGASGAQVGLAWATGVGAEVALLGWGGGLFARVRPPRLLALAFAGAALRWILIAAVGAPWLQLALAPLHAVSFGTVWVASLSYVKERAAPDQLATAQGIFTASNAAGMVIAMPIWGELYQRRGGPVTFGVAAAVSVVASATAAWLAARDRPFESST